MNKAELIAQIAEDDGVTKTQANAALDSFVDTVTKALKKATKLPWLVLVLSLYLSVLLVQVVTLRLAKRSRSRLRKLPASKLVKN